MSKYLLHLEIPDEERYGEDAEEIRGLVSEACEGAGYKVDRAVAVLVATIHTKNPMTPVYLDVERNNEGEIIRCCVCGEDGDEGIQPGDEMVWEPHSDSFASGAVPVEPAHPGCSVANGYRLRWEI